jgi:hypothetical protein
VTHLTDRWMDGEGKNPINPNWDKKKMDGLQARPKIWFNLIFICKMRFEGTDELGIYFLFYGHNKVMKL